MFDHILYWKKWLPLRKGTRCKVLARGRKNNILVQFEDGYKVITHRYAVRRLKGGDDIERALWTA